MPTSVTTFVAAAALAICVLAVPAHAEASTVGAYRNSGDPAGMAEFEQWTGDTTEFSWALDFLPYSTWSSIESAQWWAAMWAPSRFRTIYSIPMIPATGGTLAEGASGANNDHFRRLAQTLVAGGESDAVLRLGWEFNGNWFPWRASSGPANFAAYWRQIVQTVRAVPGANFQFDWSPVMSTGAVAPELAYPGDAYVDYIGLDAYDQDWNPGWEDPITRWTNMMNQPHGLRWHRDFATAHGKPMTFPEWGLFERPDGHGGGDNPYFIQKMHEWFASNNVAYALYFEHDAPDGQHSLMSGRFPRSAVRFHELFGAPAPPPPPPPPPPNPALPTNVALPQVVGQAARGQMLSATMGAWQGAAPFSFTYRWERCNSLGTGCTSISGASSSMLVLKSKDVGRTVRVRVTARNVVGTGTAYSLATAVRALPALSTERLAAKPPLLQPGLWRRAARLKEAPH